MIAFEELANYVGSKAGELRDFRIFEKIINLHFLTLNDKHFKVQLAAIDSSQSLIASFGESIEPYLGEFVHRLVKNVYSHNDRVKKQS